VTAEEASRIRKEAYGRILSVAKRRRREIEHLRTLWRNMRRLPSLDTDKPVVVVAGPPNAGKSSLVRAVSKARVEVASYPFTTKDVWVGHVARGGVTFQIMDTPGLMDRPMEERNIFERKAILCLQYAADVILFLFDPSPTRYYPLEEQVKLYKDMKENFKDILLMPVLNKIDVGMEEWDRVRGMIGQGIIGISALEGTGLDDLLEVIVDRIPPSKKGDTL
jgi:nucleolar GTP-binding protein